MQIPGGIRDGVIIKFEDWDIPRNDVAHCEKYDGNISRLKELVINNSVPLCYTLIIRKLEFLLPFELYTIKYKYYI